MSINALTYKIETVGLAGRGAPIGRIVLCLQYRDEAHHHLDEKWVILNSDTPRQTCSFTPPGVGAGSVFYSGIVEFATGGVLEIPPTAANNHTIVVGAVPPRITVTVLPLLLDWQQLHSVTVRLCDGQKKHEQLLFTPESNTPQHRSFEFPDDGKYAWSAVYQLPDGSTWSHPRTLNDSSVLVLPRAPVAAPLQIDAHKRLQAVVT